MIDQNRVQQILSEICDNVYPKPYKQGFKCRCPICGDSKKSERTTRLHVDYYQNYNDWIAKCYNGGCAISSSTTLISLYAKATGISFSEAKKYVNNDKYDSEKIKQRLKTKETPAEQKIEHNETQLPEFILSLDDEPQDRFQERYKEALEVFVKERHIPSHNKCYVSYDGKYRGRIIIPVYIDEKLMYYQARALSSVIDPKYMNPVIDKTGIVLNSDKFDKAKSIIVTEGIIDCWMVEYNQGTSCLGAYFSDELISNLYNYTDNDVILCFDNPLIDKAGWDELSSFIEESKYKNKVKYFFDPQFDYKDLNDLRCKRPEIDIYSYVLSNSYNLYAIKAKLKLLYKYSV